MQLSTTAAPITGGTDLVAGRGQDYLAAVTGYFQTGDGITLILTDIKSGLQTQIGYGDITAQSPTFALTFNNKIYLLASTRLFFSALDTPTVFNDPNGAGNGYIPLQNTYGTEESGVAIATYQGKLAVFARRSIQIWAIDPDPKNNAKQQVLENIGAVAKLTVRGIGDYDVLFLADSGIRSLRPRELSNNALIADMGTPIDQPIQATLSTLTDVQKAAACGVVEPSSNRYWCYIPSAVGTGKIYVFSYFPSGNIAAWTTYTPSYDVGGNQVEFIPEKFWTVAGQVYCRAGDNVFVYGGLDNNTYDDCRPTARIPWLDCGTPAQRKFFSGADFGFEGKWLVEFSGDYAQQTFRSIYEHIAPSFQLGNVPLQGKHGTHFAINFTEKSTGYARFCSALIHFRMEDEKK